MLQALRDALHNKIDTFVDSQDGFDENGMASPSLRGVLNANRALASYVPGIGDVVAGAADSATSKQAMKESCMAPWIPPSTRRREREPFGASPAARSKGSQASMRD